MGREIPKYKLVSWFHHKIYNYHQSMNKHIIIIILYYNYQKRSNLFFSEKTTLITLRFAINFSFFFTRLEIIVVIASYCFGSHFEGRSLLKHLSKRALIHVSKSLRANFQTTTIINYILDPISYVDYRVGILYFSLIYLKSKQVFCCFFLHHLCIWSAKGLLHDKKNVGLLTIK